MSQTIFAKDHNDLEQNLDASESNQQSNCDQNYDIIQKQEFQKDQQNFNYFFAKISLITCTYFAILSFFTYVILNFSQVGYHFYNSHHLGFYLIPNLIALIILKMYLAYDNKHSEFIILPLFCVDLFVSLKVILGLFYISTNGISNPDDNSGYILLKVLTGIVLVCKINIAMKIFKIIKITKLVQTFILTTIGVLYMQIFQRYIIQQSISIQSQIINLVFILGLSIYIIYQENMLVIFYPKKIYKNQLLKIFYHYQVDWIILFDKNLLKLIYKKFKNRKQNKEKQIESQVNNEQNLEEEQEENEIKEDNKNK